MMPSKPTEVEPNFPSLLLRLLVPLKFLSRFFFESDTASFGVSVFFFGTLKVYDIILRAIKNVTTIAPAIICPWVPMSIGPVSTVVFTAIIVFVELVEFVKLLLVLVFVELLILLVVYRSLNNFVCDWHGTRSRMTSESPLTSLFTKELKGLNKPSDNWAFIIWNGIGLLPKC